jgi:hypothetical protein
MGDTMLKVMHDLPPDVLGIEASGEVTHLDYRSVLIPEAEARLARGPIRMLFVAGPGFNSYALDAMWDDAAFGMKHWRDFIRIAVVTDNRWMRASVTLVAPLIPAQVRLFGFSQRDAAKSWITAAIDHPA